MTPEEAKLSVGVMMFFACESDPAQRRILTCTGTRIGEKHVLYADHCLGGIYGLEKISEPSKIRVWSDLEAMRTLLPTRSFECRDPAPFLGQASTFAASAIFPGRADIALLKVEGMGDQVPIVALGDPKTLRPGEELFVIGAGTTDCDFTNLSQAPRLYGLGKGIFDAFMSVETQTPLQAWASGQISMAQKSTSYACNGDSGAGVFRYREGRAEVVATLNGGYAASLGGRTRVIHDSHRLDSQAACELFDRAFAAEPSGPPAGIDTLCPGGQATPTSYCQISQSLCAAPPSPAEGRSFVGTFVDGSPSMAVDPAPCLARAQDYARWCNNPPGTATSASFFTLRGFEKGLTFLQP